MATKTAETGTEAEGLARSYFSALGFEPDVWQHIAESEHIEMELFHRTARVRWPSANLADGTPPVRGDRGEVKDMSARSRMDAAHNLGSAPCTWLATSLLTFPFTPAAQMVKATLEKFTRRWRSRWTEPVCGWVMEMTRAGRPHFHLFHSAESVFGRSLAAAAEERGFETVRRKNHKFEWQEVELFRGPAECWLVETWLDCLGGLGEYEERCRAFHRGGIVERLRSPDAAGRYVASEAGKRYQKKLPAWYQSGLGRWWNIARHLRPKVIEVLQVNRENWPFPFPFRYVWDSDTICKML